MVRELILRDLKSRIDPEIVDDLVAEYERLLSEHRKGDSEAALNASGKFVEHVLRAVEFIRIGTTLPEIRSVPGAIKEIEKDGRLEESLRALVPLACSLIFNLRSKRGAAHVKQIDPRQINSSLAAQAASWIMAEFVRLYHLDDEKGAAQATATLMRWNVPLVEQFGHETVVTTPMRCEVAVLLKIFASKPNGVDRRGLSNGVKHSPSSITRAVQWLEEEIYLHRTQGGIFHVTGRGERWLGEAVASISGQH